MLFTEQPALPSRAPCVWCEPVPAARAQLALRSWGDTLRFPGTAHITAARRFWGEALPAAGVTQTLLLGASCVFGQARLGGETRLGASEPFPCAKPGSAEVEPIVTAQGCFCYRQHRSGQHCLPTVVFARPVPLPPRPVLLRARGRGSGCSAVGGPGTDAWGISDLMMKYALKNAFALLRAQCWRRNSKYVVNRNSSLFCFCFLPPK